MIAARFKVIEITLCFIIGKTEKSAVAFSHSVNSILKSRIGEIIRTRSGKDKEIVPFVSRILNYALISFCACHRAPLDGIK